MSDRSKDDYPDVQRPFSNMCEHLAWGEHNCKACLHESDCLIYDTLFDPDKPAACEIGLMPHDLSEYGWTAISAPAVCAKRYTESDRYRDMEKTQMKMFPEVGEQGVGMVVTKKDSSWNGVCRCGHRHSEHGPIISHNYTAGKCSLCSCEYFVHDPKRKPLVEKEK